MSIRSLMSNNQFTTYVHTLEITAPLNGVPGAPYQLAFVPYDQGYGTSLDVVQPTTGNATFILNDPLTTAQKYICYADTEISPSGSATLFLNQQGQFVAGGGGGDVSSNISSSTLGNISLFADTSGKLITENSMININGTTLSIRSVPYTWPSSQGALNSYLKNDGSGNLSWNTISASGDVISDIASSTVGKVCYFSNADGKHISNSTTTADLSANIVNINATVGGINLNSANNMIVTSTQAYTHNAREINLIGSQNLAGTFETGVNLTNNTSGQVRLENNASNDIIIISNGGNASMIANTGAYIQSNTSNISLTSASQISLNASGLVDIVSTTGNISLNGYTTISQTANNGITISNNTSNDITITNSAGGIAHNSVNSITNSVSTGNYYVTCSNTGAQISLNSDADCIAQSNNNTVKLYGNDSGANKCVQFYFNGSEVSYVDNAGLYVTVSKRAVKENIINFNDDVLKNIDKLQPVNYNLIFDKNKKEQLGFILEDIPQEFKYLISNDGVNYQKLSLYLLQAMKQLNKKYDDLKNDVELLKKICLKQ